MRILIFNWRDGMHPQAGGAEVYTDELARSWASSGHDVTLFCGHSNGLANEERTGSFRTIRRGSAWSVYSEARAFYKREGRGSFDLIIDEVNTRPFHTPRYVFDAPIVALIHQIAREVWDEEIPWPASVIGRRLLEPRWLRQYRDLPILTVSESSRSSLLEFGLEHVVVVPEGLNPPALRPRRKEATPTTVFVGRMARNKRPDHALEAHEIARCEIPDLQLTMIGSGAMFEKLSARPRAGVTFLGRVSEVKKTAVVGRSHALIATSVREGWGLMVSEAAAVGTPAIAYSAPGLVDSVAACGGVLVAPNPEAVAREIMRQAPSWGATEATPLPTGTIPWPQVAEIVLARACAAVGLSTNHGS